MLRDRRRHTRMIAARVKADPGAQARIAAMTGEDETTVAHWFSSGGAREYRMPVDVLATVIDALNAPELASAILAEVELDVVPRARPTSSPMHAMESIGRLFKAVGDVSSEIAAAGADIDADEAERIYAQGMRARAELDALLARLPRGPA